MPVPESEAPAPRTHRQAVAGFRDHLVAALGQDERQTLAQQDRVVSNQNPHGITACTVVGPPTGETTDN